MIELMKQLCALPGPSGCEDAVREFVLEKVKPFADEMKTDAIGNIMVFRKGKKALERPVVLCAHMDEVGVIIKKITDDGMLKFGFVGGVDPRVVIGRPVRFGDVQGVIGIKAVHLTTAAERRTMPKTKDLYIDIGAASKAAAEDKVSLGDYGVFDSAVVEFGDGLIKAKAIDDRVGCAALLKLIEDEPPIDTWFCFTVQEEVGLRGAASMAYALDPGFAMVLEGTTAADLAVQGVIGIKAVHLTTAAERRTMPKTKDLYIDIGAASKAAAEDKVSLGDYGVFDSAVVEFGDGLIKAKAIDDRVGCAALLKLIEDEPPIDTWFCFTVQEEVGLRGAASMAYALDPGFAMVLEGTTAADLAEVEGGKAVCRVRGGVVLPFMDGATIYDAELFELLRNACDKRGIRWQTKTRVAGGTDAGRIHKSRAGVRVCAAAAPVRYIHSPSSVAAVADCEAVLSAARAFLEELGGDDE